MCAFPKIGKACHSIYNVNNWHVASNTKSTAMLFYDTQTFRCGMMMVWYQSFYFCLISDEWSVYSGRFLSVPDFSCASDVGLLECKSRCRLEPNCHAFNYQVPTRQCCLKPYSWGENGFYDALGSDGDMVHYSQHCPLGNVQPWVILCERHKPQLLYVTYKLQISTSAQAIKEA